MPLIRVDGPKIALDRKRRLVQELTQAAVNAYEMDREHIVVLITENAPENVGVAGELIADRKQRESDKPD